MIVIAAIPIVSAGLWPGDIDLWLFERGRVLKKLVFPSHACPLYFNELFLSARDIMEYVDVGSIV